MPALPALGQVVGPDHPHRRLTCLPTRGASREGTIFRIVVKWRDGDEGRMSARKNETVVTGLVSGPPPEQSGEPPVERFVVGAEVQVGCSDLSHALRAATAASGQRHGVSTLSPRYGSWRPTT